MKKLRAQRVHLQLYWRRTWRTRRQQQRQLPTAIGFFLFFTVTSPFNIQQQC